MFIVFAKVDGEKFTALHRRARARPGFTVGRRGAQAGHPRQLDVPADLRGRAVPVENLLGEIGKGHKIAFNILNLGR